MKYLPLTILAAMIFLGGCLGVPDLPEENSTEGNHPAANAICDEEITDEEQRQLDSYSVSEVCQFLALEHLIGLSSDESEKAFYMGYLMDLQSCYSGCERGEFSEEYPDECIENGVAEAVCPRVECYENDAFDIIGSYVALCKNTCGTFTCDNEPQQGYCAPYDSVSCPDSWWEEHFPLF